MSIKVVNSMLGHGDIQVPVDVYGHVSDQVAVAAMNTLSALLQERPHSPRDDQ